MSNKIWLTSDLHMGHFNCIKYDNRPYETVEEMDEKLLANWNSIVAPEDTIYCLGDFSLSFSAVEKYTQRLQGKKYLISGNHDFCHSYHKKSRNKENQLKWIKKYEDFGWTVLPEQTTLDIPGVAIVNMCHLPYSLDGRKSEAEGHDKYKEFRPKDDGRWLLHGHCHTTWQIKDKQINCGVPVWQYHPVSLDQIGEIILSIEKEQADK